MLPEITTNYKPLPTNFDIDTYTTSYNSMRSNMTEEEALEVVISSKTQR